LRRLHIRRIAAPESCLASFLLRPGVKEKLATVLELELEEVSCTSTYMIDITGKASPA
jgi:hypothetical protein